jgi:uncharacterized membrane protein YeaQ/YmgE (transglycosylase-associated protein family)
MMEAYTGRARHANARARADRGYTASMSLIAFIVLLALEGLVVGAFARLALPGRDPMSIPQTIGVGLAGSFIAGLLVRAISGGRAAPGFLGALIVSVLIVYLFRRHRGGGLVSPGAHDPRGGRRF